MEAIERKINKKTIRLVSADLTERDVDETLDASFPASDPPSWTLGPRREPPTVGGGLRVASAHATWTGTLHEGDGTLAGDSGALAAPYTYRSRFEGAGEGTSPEELLGAAHAGCFSMFLAAQLSGAGFVPARIHTVAAVHLEAGPAVGRIELLVEAEVPRIDEGTFQAKVEAARRACPVSRALAAVPSITVTARLV